ncbi:J domain-containing protein 1 [Sporothrix epigloea]|uniref:J domain-containing protein 1 n=1 Tax=Sporothrix epigloea TaxID=1892477 RepID=A0ABP0DP84_9PEZI
MILQASIMGACPCCCRARYAFTFTRPSTQQTMAVAPLGRSLTRSFSRRPTIHSTAFPEPAAVCAGPMRTFATAAHNQDTFKHHDHHDNCQDQDHDHDKRAHRRRQHDSSHSHHGHTWPASKHPTPYEVLGLPKTAAYQKKRFYALAKQYHPDLHHCAPTHLQGLTHAERLERYRLLVAANDLLSHTGRRRMYDLYGQGWAASKAAAAGSNRNAHQDRDWRTRRGTAAYNATWEDWEQWRRQNGGSESTDGADAKQTEQFMSNGGFALIVLFAMCVGGWGQAMRATSQGASILDMRDQQHRAVLGALRDRQDADAQLSREDRVGVFLERREGWHSYDMAMEASSSPDEDGNRRSRD